MSKRNVGRGLNAVSDGRNPQRPGSRLRKNAVIGRARQELAAAVARDAVARGAAQYAELVELQKVERRRVERIERDGVSVNDIALVCGLAQGMTGGIGPKGIAMRFEKVIPTISRALRDLLRHSKKRTDQEDNFTQGMALALAELNRKFDQPTEVAEVLRDAGLDDLDKLRKAGVDQYDLDELAKCLPSTPDPDWRKGAKQRATRLCAKCIHPGAAPARRGRRR